MGIVLFTLVYADVGKKKKNDFNKNIFIIFPKMIAYALFDVAFLLPSAKSGKQIFFFFWLARQLGAAEPQCPGPSCPARLLLRLQVTKTPPPPRFSTKYCAHIGKVPRCGPSKP